MLLGDAYAVEASAARANRIEIRIVGFTELVASELPALFIACNKLHESFDTGGLYVATVTFSVFEHKKYELVNCSARTFDVLTLRRYGYMQ